MGKFKKNKNKSSHRHDPLDKEILEIRFAKPSSRHKIRSRSSKDEEFVDNKSTTKILKEARRQQEDLEEDTGINLSHVQQQSLDDSTDEAEIEDLEKIKDDDIDIPIDEDTAKAIDCFMSNDPDKRATLADIIKEKITEKQTEIYTIYTDAGSSFGDDGENTKTKHIRALAPVLQNYRSGKLPALFKVIPKFRNHWEYMLCLTEPDKWSAATVYQATRIFSSNLDDRMAQRFYNLILLPRLRDDIAECKKLNVHLYRALEKALFKPAAFFKGIVIPLCKSGDCTYREATVIGSVLAKRSVPVLHSSAALLTIAEMDYFGVGSIFMRILLEKKYALPYRVVNAVAAHFIRFTDDTRTLPLLWHQCLLTFIQLYRLDLSQEQKEGILKLLTVHHHKQVTPEIRKELEQKTDVGKVMTQLWKL